MSNTNQSKVVSTPYQFWLIERGPNQGHPHHEWWNNSPDGAVCGWKTSVHDATQFPTKEAAERVKRSNFGLDNDMSAVTSHSFVQQPSPDLCPKCGSEEWDYVYEAGRVSPSYKRCAYSACDTEWSAQ